MIMSLFFFRNNFHFEYNGNSINAIGVPFRQVGDRLLAVVNLDCPQKGKRQPG